MIRLVSSFAFAAILAAATPAVAQTQAQPQPQPAAAKVSDANQVICEKQEEIGTRLAARKVCHTRSEWAQIRGDDRSLLEHTQQERSLDGNGH